MAADSKILVNLTRIILDNLDNDQFTVSELARIMDMSRSSLHRKIKELANVSASAYVRRVKLDRALNLLQESSANISEIAFESGFQSIAYFDKCFKDQFGCSPKQVRQKDGKKQATDRVEEEAIESQTNAFLPDHTGDLNKLHHFPVPATSFIGRYKEMEAIKELLKSHRLVSLVGSGGCGKTRLACELLANMDQHFEDGIWFVDLSPVINGDMVVKEIMVTLNIPESPGEEMMATIVRRIREKRMLIVLDNCEHLAGACAEAAERLIRMVTGLKILTTSRMVLNIRGEITWRIPSLSLINPDDARNVEKAQESEAILLFSDRAGLGDHRFELENVNIYEVATICKQVDGIPLAIELVASRIRYMDPGTMIQRLSDRFSELISSVPGTVERHRTLKATFDWSYNLLTTEEKTLFKRLGVFSGGFDLIAVEEVCMDRSLPGEYILDLLAGLIDRSMVNTIRNPGQPIRYYLLETLRQYSLNQLKDTEENKLRKKHFRYYLSVAEEAYKERLISQASCMGRLQMEHDNMLAALDWSEHHDLRRFTLLAGALAWFWARSNNYHLGQQVLGKIVSMGVAESETKARILSGYGWTLAGNIDQYSKLMDYAKQIVSIRHRLGNLNEEAVAIADMALLYFGCGDDENALKTASKAYEMAQISNDPGVLLYCMIAVSQGFIHLKKLDDARSTATKMITLAEKYDHLLALFSGHHNLGDCAMMEGKFREAEREYAKALEIVIRFGYMHYVFTDLLGMSMAIAGMGRHEKALRLVAAVNEGSRKAGTESLENMRMGFWQELVKQHIIGIREKLGEELTLKYESEGLAMDLEEAIRYALDFELD